MKKSQEGMISQGETKDLKKVRLHERPVHPTGYMLSSKGIHGAPVEGATYSIGEKEYVLISGPDGKQVICDRDRDHTFPVTKDQKAVKEILKMRRENHNISKARALHAKELAKGDPDMKVILEWHMAFEDGPISEPIIKDGITFYKVGRNASHDFYAGTKDGKKYAYSVYKEWVGESDTPILHENIREIEDWGREYMGHS